ncbi:Latrophilin-like protein [Dirofilaria immitis]
MLILYIITYVTLVATDSPIHCQNKSTTDICLNNGTCLLTSKSAAYQLCYEDEIYFSGNCYKVVKDKKTWYEANKACETYGGSLVAIENEFQQFFISDYLLSSLKADILVQNVAVWTAGHMILNGSQQVYVWTRNKYANEIDFWQNGQPQMTDDCIEIDSRSMFHEWILVNCSDKNYFICSRPIKMDELENVQCTCYNGYRGRFCDQSFNEFGMTFESQSLACTGNEFEFSCSSGGSIHVDFAAYGNINVSNKLCPTSASLKLNITYWEECVHPSSLQTIISMCQGLTHCRIKNLQSLFPDSPCLPTTPVALQYRMRCLFEPMIKCPPYSIYKNERCYIPNVSEKPLSFYNAQKECRKKGGQLAFSVSQIAQNEIAVSVRQRTHNNRSACYWMDRLGSLKDSLFCECYCINGRSAFWNQRSCNSSQQWICQFAPELTAFEPTEIYNKFMEQHTISHGLSNDESASSRTLDDETNFRSKRSFCEEYEWNGIIVPRTLICSETQILCPDPENIIGVTTQKCSCESSRWEGLPSTTNCTHKWVELLNQMINNGTSAEYISREWVQFLRNSTKLYGGDILGSIDIGEKLLSLAEMQYTVLEDRKERNEKIIGFTEIYGEAGNELLSDYVVTVWLTLPDDVRIDKISSLISLLERSAALMAKSIIEGQGKIEYSNWAFEVQVKKPIPTAIQSSHADDSSKSKLIRRSHTFDVTSLIDTTTLSTAANTAFNDFNGNITFNFSHSPRLLMPPLKILRQSAEAAVLLSTFNGSGPFARPRSRVTPLSGNPLLLVYYIFRSVGALLHTNETTITNSLVIGANVNDLMNSISLPESYPVTFKFYHIRTSGVNNPRCVFWDTSKKTWNQEGCKILRTINDSTECSCTHLTSFAILMDIAGLYGRDEESVVNQILNLATIIGCSFSIICLFFALLVFTCFRSLWSVRHIIHRNLCFCLLLAELIFVIGIDRTENKMICRTVAVTLHYLFLAAFCWMLLEGYQLYLMLVQVFENEEGKTILYYFYAYGFPAVIVTVTAGVAWSNYGTDQYCWLNVETPTIWAFAGPIAVVIVSNIIFLGIALQVVISVPSRHRQRSQTEQILGWLKGSLTLLCLLGITWIFGYLMIIQGAGTIFAYIFTVLNCLQGVFIFVFHIILNDKVRLTLLRSLRVNIYCFSDSGPANSILSSRQKLIDMMKNNDLSHAFSQPLADLKKKKGSFAEKMSSRMDGTGSLTTMITYLEWKRKVSNDSKSFPSDDSINYEYEKKEVLPIPTDFTINLDVSRENSNINKQEKFSPMLRKINCSNNNGSKMKQKNSSEKSVIIERF